MTELLLIRYGELALKSPPVRREFEGALRRNLLDQFVTAGLDCRVRSDRGHLYVDVADATAAARVARRVFGVTSLSAVVEVPTDLSQIRDALLPIADPLLPPGRSFAVRARRTGQHAFTSQTLAADLGAAILARWPDRALRVDLTTPEAELFVEVRGPRTYLSTGRWQGPGGLPLGVAGRTVAVVDGIRGALGAYQMMKRGCRCAFVVGPEGIAPVREVLVALDPKARQRAVGSAPSEVEAAVRETVEATHADGIVLPLAVEEFAEARERWGDRVVFSPTVSWTEEEVAARWESVRSLVA